MRFVITGAAGFIGSTLCSQLLDDGHLVLGVDCYTDYYDAHIKRERAAVLGLRPGYQHLEADIAAVDISDPVEGADAVIHLAAQPGVRLSWDHFDRYVYHNLTGTQKVLDAVRRTGVRRVVVASSSSVYGNDCEYPTREDHPTRPYSPYGVTKRAMEDLCWSFVDNWGLSVIALRYFTVYGPSQRPDMAIHRFITQALTDQPVSLYDDGEQVRDFTYVDDVVSATLSAATEDLSSSVINVAGGESASINQVLALVAEHTEMDLVIRRGPRQPGDVRATGGSTIRAQRLLDWYPSVGLSDGIRRQVEWQRRRIIEGRTQSKDASELRPLNAVRLRG